MPEASTGKLEDKSRDIKDEIFEEGHQEEQRADQSIGQYFLNNYNGQTWRGDLSSDE